MKRLCVFYKGHKQSAEDWLGKLVEWVVCKECQKKLQKGERLELGLVNKHEGERQWIELADSDPPGAFKVYRRAAPPREGE